MVFVANEERKRGRQLKVLRRSFEGSRSSAIRRIGRPSVVVRFARSCCSTWSCSFRNFMPSRTTSFRPLLSHPLQAFLPPKHHSGMRPVLLRRCHRLLSTPLYSCKRATKSLRRPLIHNSFTSRSLSTPPHALHQHDTLLPSEDTIFALSSAPGRAAIAIVRISGPACVEVIKFYTSIRGLNSVSPIIPQLQQLNDNF